MNREYYIKITILKIDRGEDRPNEDVNFRNALLLRSLLYCSEVGLINKFHLSYKLKLLGTEGYEKGKHDPIASRQYMTLVPNH